MSGYNLPPGVTTNDIDRAAGVFDEPCGCDEGLVSQSPRVPCPSCYEGGQVAAELRADGDL